MAKVQTIDTHTHTLTQETAALLTEAGVPRAVHGGADRVMLGSDYPYDMGMPDRVRGLRISGADKASILGARAETLLSEKVS